MSSQLDSDESDVVMGDNDDNLEEDLEVELEGALNPSDDEDEINDEAIQIEDDEFPSVEHENEDQESFEFEAGEQVETVEEIEEDSYAQLAALEEETRNKAIRYQQHESELLDLLSHGPLDTRPEDTEQYQNPLYDPERTLSRPRIKELEEEVADLYYQIEGSGGFKEQIGNLESTIHGEELIQLRTQLEVVVREKEDLERRLGSTSLNESESHQIGYALRSDGTYDFDFFSTPIYTTDSHSEDTENQNVILVSPRTLHSRVGQEDELRELKEKYDNLEEMYNDLVGGGTPKPSERKNIEALQAKVKEQQEEIAFFVSKITESEAERMSLLGKAKAASEQLASWQQRFEEEASRNHEQVQEYTHDISKKDAEIRRLSDQTTELKAQHELLVLSQQELLSAHSQPQDRINEGNDQIEELKYFIKTQEETIQNLTSDLETQSNSLTTSQNEVLSLRERISYLTKTERVISPQVSPTTMPESQSLHMQLLEKEQEIADLQEVKASYSSLREVYHRDISHLQSAIEEQKQKGKEIVNDLQRRLSENRRGRHHLEDKVVSLGGSIDNPLFGSPAERDNPMDTVMTEPPATEQEIRQKEEELQNMKKENEELVGSIAGLNKILKETIQEKDALLEKLTELRKNFDDTVKENTALKKKGVEQEKAFDLQLAKQRDENKQLQKRIDKAEKAIENLEKEKKAVEKAGSHMTKSSEAEQIEKRNAELEAQNKSLLQQIAFRASEISGPILPPHSQAKKSSPKAKPKASPKPKKAKPPLSTKRRLPAQRPEAGPISPPLKRSTRASRNPQPVYTYPTVLTGRVTKNIGSVGVKGNGNVEALQESPLEPEFERDPDWKGEDVKVGVGDVDVDDD